MTDYGRVHAQEIFVNRGYDIHTRLKKITEISEILGSLKYGDYRKWKRTRRGPRRHLGSASE